MIVCTENMLYLKMKSHVGHLIAIEDYNDGENLAIVCGDCYEVIIDADRLDREEEL